MQNIRLLVVFMFMSIGISAQTNKLTVDFSNGTAVIQQYSASIFKITFTTKEYSYNENISDAVLLKPMPSINSKSIQFQKKYIAIGNSKVKIEDAYYENGYRTFKFSLADDEKMYGGGERALPLNRRGYRFNLYNNPWYGYSEGADNLNYSVPFFTSNKGYGLFFDNPSKGYADIGKTTKNVLEVGFVSGELNVYVILGNNNKEILQSYHQLTGTQPLPPRWALGNFMSRFGYTSEQQVTDIAAKMKAAKIPVDAVIFDLFWFGDSIKQTMGNLDWVNKKKWPNPKKMIADFKREGINTILITEPFVVESSLNYESSKQFHATDSAGKPFMLTDFYFGRGGLIDIFRKDAQQWFWNKHKPQMNIGVEAWWGDLGEPEKHPSSMHHNLKDLGFKRLFKADEVHNLYGHIWTKMLYQFYQKEYPNKRLFSLNRSAFAGTQRYSIFPWTGDVSRSWSGLKAQLPVLLGMSMSGVPYVHSDAGGFAGGEGDNELYVRWLQMAAFTPIFRPHGTALYEIEKAAFSFPSEPALIDTPYKAYAREMINLRYRLLPYNYSLAYKQTTKGEPLMAPLYYHFPDDATATTIEDEYMWGEQILVAPVLNKGAKSRKVYLPAGNWYHPKEKFLTGGIQREFTVPLNEILYFYKAGSFIASLPINDTKIEYLGVNNIYSLSQKEMLIQYIPSTTKSSEIIYTDDGTDKMSISKKNYQIIHCKSSGFNNKHCLIEIISKEQKKFIENITLFIPLQKTIREIKINGVIQNLANNNNVKVTLLPDGRLAFQLNTNQKNIIELVEE